MSKKHVTFDGFVVVVVVAVVADTVVVKLRLICRLK
jgi:hypothetical protein